MLEHLLANVQQVTETLDKMAMQFLETETMNRMWLAALLLDQTVIYHLKAELMEQKKVDALSTCEQLGFHSNLIFQEKCSLHISSEGYNNIFLCQTTRTLRRFHLIGWTEQH